MKLKKVLRIVIITLYWFIIGYLILLCIFKKDTMIASIAFGFCLGSILCNIIIYISKYIANKRAGNRMINGFKCVFSYLSQSHSARYSCFLNGDTEGAEEFEEIIDMCTFAILKIGPNILEDKRITKEQREEVQEIIDKTKNLMNTIQPPV